MEQVECWSTKLWRCGRCGLYLEPHAFNLNRDPSTNAKRPYSFTCKNCARSYARERKAAIKAGTWKGSVKVKWRRPTDPHCFDWHGERPFKDVWASNNYLALQQLKEK